MNPHYHHLFDYLFLGWSIIPLKPRTLEPATPLLPTVWNQSSQRRERSWHPYRFRRTDPYEITEWAKAIRDVGVAVVAGTVSKLAVLAVTPEGFEQHVGLPDAQTVLSTSGQGMRMWYAYEGPPIAPETELGIPGISIASEGRWVLAPPSRHPQGRLTQWGIPPRGEDSQPPAPLPTWATEKIIPLAPHVATSPTLSTWIGDYYEAPERKQLAEERLLARAIAVLAPLVRGAGLQALQDAAFQLGQMLPERYTTEREAINVLLVAADQMGYDGAELYPTLVDSLKDGATDPYFFDREGFEAVVD